jgi:NADH-quinone oxidoreductase subunit N
MLYGMSLLYGATGTITLAGIAEGLAEADRALAFVGVLFVIAGFGFKISSVPFHFWAPDTYEGSPIPVAAYLSVASKAAGFAGLLQVAFVAFAPTAGDWTPLLAVLAVLTMTLGNLVALQQRQVVRLLAYSSVAQAGYIMVPFALIGTSPGVDERAFSAAVLYILIYAVMNLGAFAVVIALSREAPGVLISDFAGLGRRAPVLSVAMLLFLLSLGGLPPLAGFWAKFFIFEAAITAGQAWLAVFIVVNSVISLYYYIAVARQMFFEEAVEPRPFRAPALVTGVVGIAAVLIVLVGIYPDLFATFPPAATLP